MVNVGVFDGSKNASAGYSFPTTREQPSHKGVLNNSSNVELFDPQRDKGNDNNKPRFKHVRFSFS